VHQAHRRGLVPLGGHRAETIAITAESAFPILHTAGRRATLQLCAVPLARSRVQRGTEVDCRDGHCVRRGFDTSWFPGVRAFAGEGARLDESHRFRAAAGA